VNSPSSAFHPGFGMTITLPAAVVQINAAPDVLHQPPVTGEDAFKMGVASVLVAQDDVRPV
jgi:enoyl-CoA hydratase/carnithine racemase